MDRCAAIGAIREARAAGGQHHYAPAVTALALAFATQNAYQQQQHQHQQHHRHQNAVAQAVLIHAAQNAQHTET